MMSSLIICCLCSLFAITLALIIPSDVSSLSTPRPRRYDISETTYMNVVWGHNRLLQSSVHGFFERLTASISSEYPIDQDVGDWQFEELELPSGIIFRMQKGAEDLSYHRVLVGANSVVRLLEMTGRYQNVVGVLFSSTVAGNVHLGDVILETMRVRSSVSEGLGTIEDVTLRDA